MQTNFPVLYEKYQEELYHLARRMRSQYHAMLARGDRATFGDVEGEAMYLLLRELQPETVFEISPDCGWSTNYILAALTENNHGQLHSFELDPRKNGRPIDRVLKDNLHPDWDQSRLNLHIGDALETTEQIEGSIDFLFMDSCHEAFFAEWYIENLFPRVDGVAFVQDIAFEDELEPSGEADVVWDWIGQNHPQVTLIGDVESCPDVASLRRELPEHRGLRSNSVVFHLPIVDSAENPELSIGPKALLGHAEGAIEANDVELADRLLNRAVDLVLQRRSIVHRHRLLLRAGLLYRKLGEHEEASRCYNRALGLILQADKFQRQKGLKELSKWCLKHGQLRRLGTTWWLRVFDNAA